MNKGYEVNTCNYYTTGDWLRWVIPNLWNKVTCEELYNSSITPNILKNSQYWFIQYCMQNGNIIPKYEDYMSDDLSDCISKVKEIISLKEQAKKKTYYDESYLEKANQKHKNICEGVDYTDFAAKCRTMFRVDQINQQKPYEKIVISYVPQILDDKKMYFDHQWYADKLKYRRENISNTIVVNNQQNINQSSPISSQNEENKEKIQIATEQEIQPKHVKFNVEQLIKAIQNVDQNELEEIINPDLLKQIYEMQQWQSIQEFFEVSLTWRAQQQKARNQTDFKKGTNQRQPNKYNSETKWDMNRKQSSPSSNCDIYIGKKQLLSVRTQKQQLKRKAATLNYAVEKQREGEALDQINKAKREINYNLNRIAPQNLNDISRDLTEFVISNKQICETLIDSIIEKAWFQPKYTNSYAKLCRNFSKIKSDQYSFKFAGPGQSQKKFPYFKYILIGKVQEIFGKINDWQLQQFQSKQEEEHFLQNIKKQLSGNIKFIAQLIKSKVLMKMIIRQCISDLFSNFLKEYSLYIKNKKFRQSLYYFQFELLIDFLEALGQKYEDTDDVQRPINYSNQQIIKNVKDICSGVVEYKPIKNIQNLKANQYFVLLQICNRQILEQKQKRISALLQNLCERRANNWKIHHVEAENPKKLKDLTRQNDNQIKIPKINREQKKEENIKVQLVPQLLRKQMKLIIQKFDENDRSWELDFKKFEKNYSKRCVYKQYLKTFPETQKNKLISRLDICKNFILNKNLNIQQLKKAWCQAIEEVVTQFVLQQMPFYGTILAILLQILLDKKIFTLQQSFVKFNENSEDDDEADKFRLMQNIYQKLYYYTNNEQILKYVQKKQKLFNLLIV